jgi:hypothetical protein
VAVAGSNHWPDAPGGAGAGDLVSTRPDVIPMVEMCCHGRAVDSERLLALVANKFLAGRYFMRLYFDLRAAAYKQSGRG